MSKGGFRSLAGRKGGRPRGAKDKTKRLPRRDKATPEQLQDARQRARTWLTANEAPVLAALMESGDNRIAFEVLKLMKSYGDGPPTQRLEITARKSPEQILEEIALRRLAVDVEVLTEAPLPARAPVPAQIAAPEPQEAVRGTNVVLGETHYMSGGQLVAIVRPEVKGIERELLGLPPVPVLNDKGEVAKPLDTSAWVRPGDDW